ncbi:MAG: hypothetical protein IPN36_06865 [Bacteroidetes bacterium]|nr:hypothetical protein [Bacteroidota bacterium]
MRLDLSGSYTTEKSWWNDRQSFVVVKGLAESRWRTTYASMEKEITMYTVR